MSNNNLELYIHTPFCVKKCAYCDFLSAPASMEAQRQYLLALLQEIRSFPRKEAYEVVSVFFGGGTPSIWPSDWIEMVLAALHDTFSFGNEPEITMECNPGTADVSKLVAYRSLGINRISFGLQSTDNRELRLLGRIHSFETFCETYAAARQAGFSNINIDLMSALPGQTPESWRETLNRVLALQPEHISAYSLIVEPGTPFAEQKLDLPDEDTEREMYARTAEILAEYGFFQYEISNYAKPGFACRHNIGYWKRTDYLGFGPSAASLFGNRRWTNTADRSLYLKACGALEKIREDEEILSRQDAMEEFMFLGLRMTQGISTAEFEEQFGKEIHAVYGGVLKKYEAMHLLQEHSGRLALTRDGISVSNVILADFLL